jgi:putative endopeptidase
MAYTAYKQSLGGKEAPVIDGLHGRPALLPVVGASVARNGARGRHGAPALATDPHSPPEYRVNGVMPNIDEWYAAFDVQPGDKMYLPPAQRVRIW